MREERLEVSVTFDERGYIGSAPELRSPVMALSLGGLRRKVESAMRPNNVRVVLQLDGLAERERPPKQAGSSVACWRSSPSTKRFIPTPLIGNHFTKSARFHTVWTQRGPGRARLDTEHATMRIRNHYASGGLV